MTHRSRLAVVTWTALSAACALPALADTYTVLPDGTGDFPTIEAAVDAAVAGDVIELGDGVFTGDGNRELRVEENLTIRSQSGDPSTCVIDCEGSEDSYALSFSGSVSRDAILEDVTIRGARAGAILVLLASPTIRGCVLQDNEGTFGGAIQTDGGPLIDGCLITGNRARQGAAIRASFTLTIEIRNTTIAHNAAERGGAIFGEVATIEVDRSIIWGNCASESGDQVEIMKSSSLVLTCSLVDDTGVLDPDNSVVYGNATTFEDPLFCDPAPCGSAPTTAGVYTIATGSPASADQSACGERIGALGIGCKATPTLGVSWGSLKGQYATGQ